MNNLEKFNDTVSILVKAYLNDTLIHGSCVACAVGNIIADKCGYKYVRLKHPIFFQTFKWKDGVKQRWIDDKSRITHSDQTIATGYTVQELMQIEKAFEGVNYFGDEDQYMLDGLMAVVDILAEIHNIDLSVKQQAKLLFAK